MDDFFDVLSRNCSPSLDPEDVLLLSSRSFIVLCYIFESMMVFLGTFLFSFLVYGYLIAPAPLDEKTTIFSLNCFWISVKNQLAILSWHYFWVVPSVSLIYVAIPLQYHGLDY